MGEEEATATKAATEPEAEAPAAAAKDAADGEAADAEPKEVVKCDRPNKEEFEAKVQTLESEIHELNDKLAKIDGNITTTKASSGGQMDELQVARDQMKVLRTRKDGIMRERQEILDQRNAAKESLDKKITSGRALRAELKYNSLEEIEKQIAELEHRQQMTSMTLQAEKKLLKEIDTLKLSKKAVAQLSSQQEAISGERAASQDINATLTEKSKELDAVKKEIEDQKAVLESLNGENSERKSALPSLFKEKDGVRSEKQAKVEEIKALRADYRKAENDFRNYQREVRKQRAESRKAEDDAYKIEKEKKKKEWEEEEAKKIPYEEEMALCDYLVNFLSTTYLGESTATAAAPVEEEKLVTEFEGLALQAGKKKFTEEDDFCNLGMGKKKALRKKGGAKKAGKLVLAVDTFEHFSMVSVEPPTSRDAVAGVVDALKAKKIWFGTQPRGALPSIRDKQIAETEKARKEARNNRDDRDAPDDRENARGRPTPPEPVKEKPKPVEKAKAFNAMEAGDSAFPGLPPAKPAAAAADDEKS